MQAQLKNVQHVQAATCRAFAAILESGAVVPWGRLDYGGDSGALNLNLGQI